MTDNQQAELLASPKWVRAFLGDKVVADSHQVKILRGHGQIPIYYFPQEDVNMALLTITGTDRQKIEQGEGPWPEPPPEITVYSVQVNGTVAENAAWLVGESVEFPGLAHHLAFVWQAMDVWYEEEEQVRFHPHDPYHLLDVRTSSRHVKVVLRGKTIADTKRPILLFEAGLPARYYLPPQDVRMDLLQPTDKTTHCAYKGVASYYSAHLKNGQTVENIAWHYPFPNYQYAPIQNLVAFPQERVDAFWVDGERVSS